jgi:hypothetical protein
MKHKWKSHKQPNTPSDPGEWIIYCDDCGAEMDDDNEHEECETEDDSDSPTARNI